MTDRCQVCGQPVVPGRKNCGIHSYVSERMAPLAQEIWRLDASVSADVIKDMAIRYKCSTSTVRNHMRRQGYISNRKWTQKGVR